MLGGAAEWPVERRVAQVRQGEFVTEHLGRGSEEATLRVDDPPLGFAWDRVTGHDVLADGQWPPEPTLPEPSPPPGDPADRSAVYLEVQRSAEFQKVRREYRSFAFPATAAFLSWYFLYLLLATAAPGLMARPVAGELNMAMAAGLAQFASTFFLTWTYARHARLRRDRAALQLRWDAQERMR